MDKISPEAQREIERLRKELESASKVLAQKDQIERDLRNRISILESEREHLLRGSASLSEFQSVQLRKGKPLILLVDDEEHMRSFLAEILADSFEVQCVESAEMALAVATENPPDLLLTDLMMPGMNGLQLLKALRQNTATRSTPIILISAQSSEESRVQGLEYGADDFLLKPVSPSELLARVSSNLKMARLRQETSVLEKELRSQVERERDLLKLFLDHAPLAIGVLEGPEYRFSLINSFTSKLFGLPPEKIMGRTGSELIPGIEEITKPVIDRVYRTGMPEQHEIEVKLPAGRRFFQVSWTPLPGENGRPRAVIYLALDITMRREIEAELRASNEKYNEVVNAIDGVVWEADVETFQFTFVSQQAERLLGYPRDQWMREHDFWIHHTHPDDREWVVEFCSQNLKVNHFYQFAYRMMRADGSVVWLRDYVSVTRENGRPVRLSGIMVDITDMRRAEEALKQSEDKFKRIFNSRLIGIIIADSEGRIIDANDAFLELVGYSHEDLDEGRINWDQLTPPEYQVLDQQARHQFLTTKSCTPYEKEYIRKDGTRIPIFFAAVSLEEADRVAVCYVLDLSHVKKTEEALRKSEQQLRLITNALPVLIGYVDFEEKFLFNNSVFGEWFGPSRKEVRGKTIEDTVGEATYRKIKPHIHDVLHGIEVSFEELMEFENGRSRYVYLTFIPHFNAERKLDGFITLMSDMTGRKKVERELEEAKEQLRIYASELEKRVEERTARLQEINAEMESFTYTVSHDLRAPVRAMQGFSQILYEDYADKLDEMGLDYARRISQAASKMDQLIRDLLAYSRVGRSQLQLESVSVTQVLEELMLNIQPLLREKAANVILQNPFYNVRAHHTSLYQALENLMLNAIKFVATGTTPRVIVRNELRDSRVRIWVEDNGIGISSEHHERIFRIFERLHGYGKYEGTGVGLAIVLKAVERMGGNVGVSSELGKGSRFWIELAFSPQ